MRSTFKILAMNLHGNFVLNVISITIEIMVFLKHFQGVMGEMGQAGAPVSCLEYYFCEKLLFGNKLHFF